MKKLLLSAFAAAVALVAFPGHTQTPGEDKGAATKPATKAEKAAAKEKRRATSKEMVKKDEGRVDANMTNAGKSATAQEKAAAKAKRKAEGAEVSKKGSAGSN